MGALDKKKKNISQIDSPYVQYQEKRTQSFERKKLGLKRRLVFFMLFAVMTTGIVLATLYSQKSALKDKEAQKQELKEQLSSLQKEEEQLKEEIIKLNDDEYIAKLARKEYFLSDDGEIIFNLPE
ncbi:cell division protein DIVIC [Pradoshia eiseniae]|uniref:Cell division protein DIVIC n=1 Tax=Pradoshia eiseniae TaxID=2064768 RepID=A0A2S7MVZ2_9BACI|nr:septum formation initiator family protein [Pradoshia eiseniae]PQD93981.1 cell division protein DIVIC [Pradoshia eiseniae]